MLCGVSCERRKRHLYCALIGNWCTTLAVLHGARSTMNGNRNNSNELVWNWFGFLTEYAERFRKKLKFFPTMRTIFVEYFYFLSFCTSNRIEMYWFYHDMCVYIFWRVHDFDHQVFDSKRCVVFFLGRRGTLEIGKLLSNLKDQCSNSRPRI